MTSLAALDAPVESPTARLLRHPRRAPSASPTWNGCPRATARSPTGRRGPHQPLWLRCGHGASRRRGPTRSRRPSSPGPGSRSSCPPAPRPASRWATCCLGSRWRCNGTGTTLYLAPTKALAADQARAIADLGLEQVRAATYDGDTPTEERDWARRHADVVLTNPDMLHHALLPGHARWASYLKRLSLVVVDECHGYRGVFGSHVAHGAAAVAADRRALRRRPGVRARLGHRVRARPDGAAAARPAGGRGDRRRVAARGARRRAVGAAAAARRRAASRPVLLPCRYAGPRPRRRADLLADLVVGGVRTVAFVRSRRGAESVALGARRALARVRRRRSSGGSRRTGRVISPRSGGPSSAHCTAAGCWGSRRPTPSSSAWTSAGSTRC